MRIEVNEMKEKKTRGLQCKRWAVYAMIAAALLAIMILSTGCHANADNTNGTNATIRSKPYSQDLENRLKAAISNDTSNNNTARPDYLPPEMFARLPPMPGDFYQVRELVRIGRITDFDKLEDRYWQQPEFFPHFEDLGLPILQNPPKDRWGAYGIATYPADSVSSINPGESLDVYFFIKSNYLVETYQGIDLAVGYPAKADIISGYDLPDGAKKVEQDPNTTQKHITATVDPAIFILEPNFPIYNTNGTRKLKMTINVSSDTPPGNYVISLDTAPVPKDIEEGWLKQYLNLYTSGSMTKLDRPYYQAFVHVNGGGK